MPTTFSQGFRQAAIEKLLSRGDQPVHSVIEKLGISRATATRWIAESGRIPSTMSIQARGKSSREYTAEQKLQAVLEFRRLREEPAKQGELLRTQGLHASVVEVWEKEILGALEKPSARSRRTPEEIAKDRKIDELERDLRRKEKALAETTAILVLKKKAESIWGLVDGEDNT
jgi:transposase